MPRLRFGCMVEWVLALNAHCEQFERFFIFPFAGDEIVRDILDKSVLYRPASNLGVPMCGVRGRIPGTRFRRNLSSFAIVR